MLNWKYTNEELYTLNKRHAKTICKYLANSWLWTNIYETCKFICENYTFEDEINWGLATFLKENNKSSVLLSDNWVFIHKPFKVKSFHSYQIDAFKKAIEEKRGWYRDRHYWAYDFSLELSDDCKRARYSAEYHNCWNWYYYIMLDWEHAVFVEKD